MQGDVSLDDLIQRERDEKRHQRQKQQEVRDVLERDPSDQANSSSKEIVGCKLSMTQRRQEKRDERKHDNRRPVQDRPHRQHRYALLIKGFVADVSTEDIYGRKVHSIKTFLKAANDKPIESAKEMPIEVEITFLNKDDADSLMREYSNKGNFGWIYNLQTNKKTESVQKKQAQKYLKPAEQQVKLFRSNKYVNPFPIWKKRDVGFMNTTSFFIENKKVQPSLEDTKVWLPVHQPITEQPPAGIIRVTWISHATVLIQDGPINILTDPIFANRSPDMSMGYQRLVDLPIKKEQLPKIHIVLISHDHFDHFDVDFVKWLYQRDQPRIYFGKGCQQILGQHRKSFPMDWMDTRIADIQGREYKVEFLPSCHWSGRGVLDHFKTLWGSFMLTTPEGKKIYFAGDTGYDQMFFKQIGQYYDGVDLSLIPIGAYEPREFLCFQHVNPEQAVKIHYDLRSKQSMAMHWGTFQLANEGFLQPRHDLRTVIEQIVKNIQVSTNFCCVQPGQSVIIGIPMSMPSFIRSNKKANFTWLGHSSVLINFDSLNILVDPYFVDYSNACCRWLPYPTLVDMPGRIDYLLFTYPYGKFVKEYMDTNNLKTTPQKAKNKNSKQQAHRIDVYEAVYLVNEEAENSVVEVKGNKVQTLILGNLICLSDFEIMQIRQEYSYATIITFKKSKQPVVCFYNGPGIRHVAQKVKELFPRITVAYVPIRPLTGFDKFEKQELDKIFSQDVLDAQRVVPINWGAFPCPSDKDIMQPMRDIQDFIRKRQANSIQVQSVGATRSLETKMIPRKPQQQPNQRSGQKEHQEAQVELKGQGTEKHKEVQGAIEQQRHQKIESNQRLVEEAEPLKQSQQFEDFDKVAADLKSKSKEQEAKQNP